MHPHSFSFISRWYFILIGMLLANLSGLYVDHASAGVTFHKNVRASDYREMSASQSNQRISHTAQIGEMQIRYTMVVQATPVVTMSVAPGEWGKAKQLDEHTWTMQVGEDSQMATSQEILSALNVYRQRNGKGTVQWDSKLAEYAQTRASYFFQKQTLDGHAGFSDYMNNQDGFHKLGFGRLGENSSYGYKLAGVHLIEWVYAGDKPHNDNQLNNQWEYVGIGVAGTATDLIFGGEKL